MKKTKQQAVTALPPSPDEERRERMRKYTIAMSIRMVCFVLAIVIPFWWRWIFVAGALILPYIAVVLANTVMASTATVLRPGAVVKVVPGSTENE